MQATGGSAILPAMSTHDGAVIPRPQHRALVRGEVLQQFLAAAGLAPDAVLASEVEGFAKPHPHLFEKAIAQLGIQPGEAVHVGDDLFYDVQGARSAHVRPLLLDRYHHEDGNTQVKVVSNLSEVLELLAARRRHQGPEQGQLALVG